MGKDEYFLATILDKSPSDLRKDNGLTTSCRQLKKEVIAFLLIVIDVPKNLIYGLMLIVVEVFSEGFFVFVVGVELRTLRSRDKTSILVVTLLFCRSASIRRLKGSMRNKVAKIVVV